MEGQRKIIKNWVNGKKKIIKNQQKVQGKYLWNLLPFIIFVQIMHSYPVFFLDATYLNTGISVLNL